MSNSLPASQKLSFSFDSIFNNYYQQLNHLDSKISTNEDLVRTYMDTYQIQSLKNESLKITLLASTLILIVVILYRVGFIKSPMILSIFIAGIIVLSMLVIYFSYYSNDFQSYLDRVNRDTQKNLEKREERPIDQKLVCDFEEEETSYMNISNDPSSSQSSYDKLLKTSSQYNVWLDGDHKSSKPINENVKEYVDESGLGVKSGFDKLDSKYATYYDCEYTGSNTNGMPIKKSYKKSTIPCDFYIDYKEKAKYVKQRGTFQKV